MLHGMLVLGVFPQRGLGLVAPGAGVAADKGEGRGRAAGTKSFGQDESALGDKHKRQSTDREGRYRDQRGYSPLWLPRVEWRGVGTVAPGVRREFGRLQCGGAPRSLVALAGSVLVARHELLPAAWLRAKSKNSTDEGLCALA